MPPHQDEDSSSLMMTTSSVTIMHVGEHNHNDNATTDKEEDYSSRRGTACTEETTASSCVEFGSVHVISHAVRLGDNPSVSEGLPIALGTKRGSAHFKTVDEFESKRGKPKPAVKLSKEERDALIRNNRHSRSSLIMARKQVKEIKLSRLDSKQRINAEKKKGKEKKNPFLSLLLGWKRKRNKTNTQE